MQAHFTPGNAVFNHQGKTKIISAGEKYDKAKAIYKTGNMDLLEQFVFGDDIVVQEAYGVIIEDGLAKIDGEYLPSALSSRIVEYVKDGMPYQYLVNFWNRLKENPSRTSVQALFEMLERNLLPILEDGRFLGWKSVRADWKDWHSGRFLNTPGSLLEIPRREVDDNTHLDCSYGFHVGAISYVNNFHNGESRKVVEVAVDPADVVSVPADAGCDKLRVCKYEVLREVTEGFINESNYKTFVPVDEEEEEEEDYDDEYDYDYDEPEDEDEDEESDESSKVDNTCGDSSCCICHPEPENQSGYEPDDTGW